MGPGFFRYEGMGGVPKGTRRRLRGAGVCTACGRADDGAAVSG